MCALSEHARQTGTCMINVAGESMTAAKGRRCHAIADLEKRTLSIEGAATHANVRTRNDILDLEVCYKVVSSTRVVSYVHSVCMAKIRLHPASRCE